MSNSATGYSLLGVQVQDEGSNLGLATFLDFTGAGVTASASGSVITVNIPGGGGGGGAPVNAEYLVLSLDATLTDERRFVPAARLSATDGGAGGNYTLDLATIGGLTPGSYTYSSVTVDAYGRVTSASSGAAPVTSVSVDAGELTNTGTATAPVLGLATTAVGAGSYTYASITVDTFGRLTAASSGAAPVTSVSVDAGELTNTGTSTAPVLGLATTAVTPGTYSSANVTVDAFGRITNASTGAGTFSVVTTSASPYVMAATVTTVFAAPVGTQTVQLPAANAAGVVAGRMITVKRINASNNVVTITSAGGTIDNVAAATGIALAAGTLDSITVQSDGTNWWVV